MHGSFAGESLRIGDGDTTAGGVIYVKRNTFTSGIYTYTKTAFGPFYFDNNVIQNSDTGDHIAQSGTDLSRVIVTNDLVGASSLVDSAGLLVNRSYVGTYGWETNNDPVNGACGTANGQTFSTTPSTNLCTSGTASNITGQYVWSCNGINGGSTANCSASYSAPVTYGVQIFRGNGKFKMR
jgi:hypothetical protein